MLTERWALRAAMEKLMMFHPRVAVVSFDEEASRHFGQIHAALTHRGVRIGPMDTLIAAHASRSA